MKLRLNNKFTVNQSVDKVWAVMADDFVNISQWASSIAESRENHLLRNKALNNAPVAGRICTAPGYGEVFEAITHFDSEAKEFHYSANASAMPNFVTNLENKWCFVDLEDSQTEVTSAATVTMNNFPGYLAAPFMRLQMNHMIKLFADELKYYVETGQIPETKLRAIAKYKKV